MWSSEIKVLAQGNNTDRQTKKTRLKLLNWDQIPQRRERIFSFRQITTLSPKWWKSPLKEINSSQIPPHLKIKPTWLQFWAKRASEVDKMKKKTLNTMQSEIVFLKNVMQVPGELVRLLWKLYQSAWKWMRHFQMQNKCWRLILMLKINLNRLSIANLTRSSSSRPIWSKNKSTHKKKWNLNPDTCPGDQSTMWNVLQARAIRSEEGPLVLLFSIKELGLWLRVTNHRLSGPSFRAINWACLIRQALTHTKA